MATGPRRRPADVAETQAAIERFLETAASPALLEPGEELIPLSRENFCCEIRSSRLVVQAWDDRRNLVRRVNGMLAQTRGKLELAIEKFGRKEGRLLLVDLARPAAQDWSRRGVRMVFRERFRRMLQREFPGWRIAALSAEPDLEHSLSPVYPRALLTEGRRAIAAIACPPEDGDAGALSFGLIWLDYLRRREQRLVVEGLAVFAPIPRSGAIALRMRWLDTNAARFDLYGYSDEDYTARLDLNDTGNIETVVEPCRRPVFDLALAARFEEIPGVQQVLRNDGEISLRAHGLEFARSSQGDVLFGLEDQRRLREENLPEALRLAHELSTLREGDGPLHQLSPELWLESQVRRELERIDPVLLTAPVYGQVPSFAGGERGVLDLLAAERGGRLAVLELKASADLHLPLQALDYWVRVAWHLDRGDFTRNGYFPGVALWPRAPRLLLISPVLEFHPTTETILGFFSPRIDVERIGLGVEWRKRVQVLFRASGAASA
jgi:hypothetical protein